MENLVRKCLNKRQACFEASSCPTWLLSILPNRIKSVETNLDNDIEQKPKEVVDLSPYKLISSIPLLNDEKQNNNLEKDSNFEYPNDLSFANDELKSDCRLIYSPSNQQLFYLFNKLKEFQREKRPQSFIETKSQCKQINCQNRTIPLTSFCKIHLLENDDQQILFVKCHQCQQISFKEDNNNILHFCPFLKL